MSRLELVNEIMNIFNEFRDESPEFIKNMIELKIEEFEEVQVFLAS